MLCSAVALGLSPFLMPCSTFPSLPAAAIWIQGSNLEQVALCCWDACAQCADRVGLVLGSGGSAPGCAEHGHAANVVLGVSAKGVPGGCSHYPPSIWLAVGSCTELAYLWLCHGGCLDQGILHLLLVAQVWWCETFRRKTRSWFLSKGWEGVCLSR